MANGRIYLNPIQNISVSETQITGLAFDYAGNLYAASSGTKTLNRYAIPSLNGNKVVTPGNGIGTASATGDVNGDGKVDIADAVSVLNVMADGSNLEAADVNGDGKVDIADFVSVLNIMADGSFEKSFLASYPIRQVFRAQKSNGKYRYFWLYKGATRS